MNRRSFLTGLVALPLVSRWLGAPEAKASSPRWSFVIGGRSRLPKDGEGFDTGTTFDIGPVEPCRPGVWTFTSQAAVFDFRPDVVHMAPVFGTGLPVRLRFRDRVVVPGGRRMRVTVEQASGLAWLSVVSSEDMCQGGGVHGHPL